MLSARQRYGLLALLHLAELRAGEVARGDDIAAAYRIPRKYLQKILRRLVTAGLAEALRGQKGGYRLAVPAKSLPVARILLALDSKIGPADCSRAPSSSVCATCSDDCGIRGLMLTTHAAVWTIYEKTTLARLSRSPAAVVRLADYRSS